jgi:hypothetical protein
MKTYYVYILKDPSDLKPFYVGKGCGSRVYQHWLDAVHGDPDQNPRLREKLKSLWEKDGYGHPIYEIVLTSTDEDECYVKEAELVELYRQDLCNLVPGGWGGGGWSRPVIDLAYQRFGRLLVLNKYEVRNGYTYWWCVCDCSVQKWVPASSLRSGDSQSCGCLRFGAQIKDLSGQRFGRLVVRDQYEVRDNKTYWFCTCDCGRMTWVWSAYLHNRHIQSCGCFRNEMSQQRGQRKKKWSRRYREAIWNGEFEGLEITPID